MSFGHGERGGYSPEVRKEPVRFTWKSRLMQGVLLGLTTLAEGNQIEHPVPPHATTAEEFAERNVPFKKLELVASKVTDERAEAEAKFVKEFAGEMATPVTRERIPELIKKLHAYYPKLDNNELSYVFEEHFKLDGLPVELKDEQDLRQYLDEREAWGKFIDNIVIKDPKHEEIVEYNDVATCAQGLLYRQAREYSNQRVPSVEIDGQTDFLKMQHLLGRGMANLVEHFEFKDLPHELHKKDLPRLRAFLFKAVQESDRDDYGARYSSFLVDEYIDSLTFDPHEFPTVINQKYTKDIVAAAKQLNDIGYWEFGLTKAQNYDFQGDHYDDRKFSFEIGTHLLNSASFEGFPGLDFKNPQQFIEIGNQLESLIKDVGSKDYYATLIPRYIENADPSSFPKFDALGLPEYENFLKAIKNSEDFQPKVGLEAILLKQAREQFYGGVVTDDNFFQLIKKIKDLEQSSGYDSARMAYLVNDPSLVKGDIAIAVDKQHRSEGQISLAEINSSPVATVLLASLVNRYDDGINVKIVGYPTNWTIDNLKEADNINLIIETASLESNLHRLKITGYEDVHLEGNWQQPKSLEDLRNIDELLRQFKSDRTRSEILKHLDFSGFPVFSARYDAETKPLYGYFQYRSFMSKLAERADYSNVQFTLSPETMDEVVAQANYITQEFGTNAGELYFSKLNFKGFPTEMNASTEADVAAVLKLMTNINGFRLAQAYANTLHSTEVYGFADVITDENLESEHAKLLFINFGIGQQEGRGQFNSTVKVSVPKAANFTEFTQGLAKISLIRDINKDAANTLEAEFMKQVDWHGVAQGIDVNDISKVEDIRKKINAAIDAAAGDKILIDVGTRAIDGEPVTWDNINQKTTFAKNYLKADGRGIPSDVLGMYTMLGSFQVQKILEFFNTEGLETDTGDRRAADIIAQLQDAGANIPITEGSLSKTTRSLKDGNFGYVLNKGFDRLLSAGVMRDEWASITPEVRRSSKKLKAGFRMVTWRTDGKELATVVIGDPSKGATVDYTVKVGGGLTEQVMRDNYPDGALVAESVGAYTTGAMKPAELAIDNGSVVNYLISNRDGAVIVDAEGHMIIVNRDKLTKHDLDSNETAEPLAFRKNLEDFSTLLSLAKKNKIDMMSGHLLVDDGELAVAGNSSNVRDKRRAIATFKDGTFGIIDFSQPMTLYEEAVIAKSMNVKGLVNLDTGYYDHAVVYDAAGMRSVLGQVQDRDGTNNNFGFLSGVTPAGVK